MKIEIRTPDKQAPGFLRRAKQATAFAEQLKMGATPQLFDQMVAYILPFVAEPIDRKEAEAALWDASQEQFEEIMSALAGGGGEGSLPPESTTP